MVYFWHSLHLVFLPHSVTFVTILSFAVKLSVSSVTWQLNSPESGHCELALNIASIPISEVLIEAIRCCKDA